MDWEKREKLVGRCGALELHNGGATPLGIPLVTIEEFYDGAEGDGGLLCNTLSEPGNYSSSPDDDRVIAMLTEIRSRPDVSDVRIAITLIEDEGWPFADTILIVTSASEEDVRDWFPEGMQPDEVYSLSEGNFVPARPDVPEGYRMVLTWFD